MCSMHCEINIMHVCVCVCDALDGIEKEHPITRKNTHMHYALFKSCGRIIVSHISADPMNGLRVHVLSWTHSLLFNLQCGD